LSFSEYCFSHYPITLTKPGRKNLVIMKQKTLMRCALVTVCAIAVPLVQSKPPAIPITIQTYLSKTFPGWKQTGTATYCIVKFQQSAVAGDFDGDGRRDYAVKFTAGGRGYIVAFVARGADYVPYVLISMSAEEIRHTGLSIGRKGQRNENEEGRTFVLRNDAPAIGTCESEACYYVYRNGGFHCE
jgi:hypothetical protein